MNTQCCLDCNQTDTSSSYYVASVGCGLLAGHLVDDPLSHVNCGARRDIFIAALTSYPPCSRQHFSTQIRCLTALRQVRHLLPGRPGLCLGHIPRAAGARRACAVSPPRPPPCRPPHGRPPASWASCRQPLRPPPARCRCPACPRCQPPRPPPRRRPAPRLPDNPDHCRRCSQVLRCPPACTHGCPCVRPLPPPPPRHVRPPASGCPALAPTWAEECVVWGLKHAKRHITRSFSCLARFQCVSVRHTHETRGSLFGLRGLGLPRLSPCPSTPCAGRAVRITSVV